MIRVNVHQAKTQLSKLLRAVQKGEVVIISRSEVPVAKLVPVEPAPAGRPPVGEATTTGVRWTEDAFRPLTDEELSRWGL